MANETTFATGVTKREVQGTGVYNYYFPDAFITADTNLNTYTVQQVLDYAKTISANFADITDKLGATDIEGYVDALADLGYYGASESGGGILPSVGTAQAYTTKFGRNSSINTNTAPEDVWNGSDVYTGHDCVVAEILETSSDDNSDSGTLVSSGTATGGSETTIIDSGATFISDGVAVGDCVINDDKVIHGIVSAVDSETQLSVHSMGNGVLAGFTNESGESYRVATTSSTGAAVVRLNNLLDSNYDRFSEYIILSGTTEVNTVGTYLRQDSASVILSGTFGNNEGELTTRQATTTNNVTMVMPAEAGRTAIACATVPRNKIWIQKYLYASIVRANGSPGSAGMRLQKRERGGSWETLRFSEVSNSISYSEGIIGGIILQPFTDVKWRVQSVSDNNTIATGEFVFFELDA